MDFYKRRNCFNETLTFHLPLPVYETQSDIRGGDPQELLNHTVKGTDKLPHYFINTGALSIAEVNSIYRLIHGDSLTYTENEGIKEYMKWCYTTHKLSESKAYISGDNVKLRGNSTLDMEILRKYRVDVLVTETIPYMLSVMNSILNIGGNALILIRSYDMKLINDISSHFKRSTAHGTVEGYVYLVCNGYTENQLFVDLSDKVNEEIHRSYLSTSNIGFSVVPGVTFGLTYDKYLIDRFWIVPKKQIFYVLADQPIFDPVKEYQAQLQVKVPNIEEQIYTSQYMERGILKVKESPFPTDYKGQKRANRREQYKLIWHRENGYFSVGYKNLYDPEYIPMICPDHVFPKFLFPEERIIWDGCTLSAMMSTLSQDKIYLKRIFTFTNRYRFIDMRNNNIFNSEGKFYCLFPDIEHFYGGLGVFTRSSQVQGKVQLFALNDKIKSIFEQKIASLKGNDAIYSIY